MKTATQPAYRTIWRVTRRDAQGKILFQQEARSEWDARQLFNAPAGLRARTTSLEVMRQGHTHFVEIDRAIAHDKTAPRFYPGQLMVVLHHKDGSTTWKHVASRAEKKRQDAKERAKLIRWLGMKPEIMTRDERYSATTGELWKWYREDLARGLVRHGKR